MLIFGNKGDNMKNKHDFARDLIQFIDKSPCSFFAIKEMKTRLEAAGYERLDETKKWNLQAGSKYYVTRNDSAIVAFRMGNKPVSEAGFKIIGSHSDSPTFRIKPNAQMKVENSYLKLNTEVYGGAILSTWFDRALSVAGRVTIKSNNPFMPKTELVNIDKDLLVIPSLCIHMNREVNNGYTYNPQVDTLPLMGMIDKNFQSDDFLLELLAKELKVDKSEILDCDLFLYDREGGKITGMNDEFIHSGRLDNLAMAHVSLEALLHTDAGDSTDVIVVTDNEEVGSMSKQGANSPFLKNTLKRIAIGTCGGEEEYLMALANSFLISADLAHALHPNYTEKHDLTNRPVINEGVVMKISARQSYTSDAFSMAVFESICQSANEKYQKFVNRSDSRGGSTIGPITTTQLDINSLDIGTPILAMHSVRELGGVDDHFGLFNILKHFYNSNSH